MENNIENEIRTWDDYKAAAAAEIELEREVERAALNALTSRIRALSEETGYYYAYLLWAWVDGCITDGDISLAEFARSAREHDL